MKTCLFRYGVRVRVDLSTHVSEPCRLTLVGLIDLVLAQLINGRVRRFTQPAIPTRTGGLARFEVSSRLPIRSIAIVDRAGLVVARRHTASRFRNELVRVVEAQTDRAFEHGHLNAYCSWRLEGGL
jgi:hypothetical protein